MRPLVGTCLVVGLCLGARSASAQACPSEMVRIDSYCVDRYEITTVDRSTMEPLSPFYPPARSAILRILDIWQVEAPLWGDERARQFPLPELTSWQRTHPFVPMARSAKGVVPQGYLSRDIARAACQAAGKRLCTMAEWQRACRGERGMQFPYGNQYRPGVCNVNRPIHPAAVLHGNSSLGHLDPRLNLVVEGGVGPLLRLTGELTDCRSRWGQDAVFDMVGNLDEWVDDDGAGFLGGFYARTTFQGCEARIRSHAPSYFDYSTGARCCRDAQRQASP